MIIQRGCSDVTRAEDGKLHSHLEWPYAYIRHSVSFVFSYVYRSRYRCMALSVDLSGLAFM